MSLSMGCDLQPPAFSEPGVPLCRAKLGPGPPPGTQDRRGGGSQSDTGTAVPRSERETCAPPSFWEQGSWTAWREGCTVWLSCRCSNPTPVPRARLGGGGGRAQDLGDTEAFMKVAELVKSTQSAEFGLSLFCSTSSPRGRALPVVLGKSPPVLWPFHSQSLCSAARTWYRHLWLARQRGQPGSHWPMRRSGGASWLILH